MQKNCEILLLIHETVDASFSQTWNLRRNLCRSRIYTDTAFNQGVLWKITFPNTSSENCTLIVYSWRGKWLIWQLLIFPPRVVHFSVSNKTVKVQFSLYVVEKITRFTSGEKREIIETQNLSNNRGWKPI